MTVLQRRVAGVVGGLSAILLVVLIVAGGPDGDDGDRLAVRGRAEHAPSTSSAPTTARAVETTLPLLPVTTGVPVPNAVEAPPPTEPPTATPAAPRAATGPGLAAGAAAGATVVDGKGAVLVRPANTTATRPVDKAKGCNSANDPGWSIANCGALRSSGTVLLWVVETKGKATRVLVLKEQTAGNWSTVLFAADDAGSAWSTVGVRGEDVSGDGQPELVVGFHRRGSDRVVSMDVVDAATAGVVVHRDLVRGVVETAKGRVSTWSAAGDGYDEVVIRFGGGAWRASAPMRVDRGAVPAPSV